MNQFILFDPARDQVHSNTVYQFLKGSTQIGFVKIHTSCSQPLFIDDMFFFKEGVLGEEIKLTVVSGFDLGGSPAIPDSSCKANNVDDD